MLKSKKPYIGIVDADLLNGGTRHPNLALLKIAGFLRDNSIRYELITDTNANVRKYTRIYISRVFTFSPLPEFYKKALKRHNTDKYVLGGTGNYATETNIKLFLEKRNDDMACLENDIFLKSLPKTKHSRRETNGIDMAAQMPDYHLYDAYVNKKIAEGRNPRYYDDYMKYSIGFLTRGCFRHCPFCVNKLEKHVEKYSEIEWFYDESRQYIYLWDDNFLASPQWKEMLQKLINTNRPFQFRQGLDERLLAGEHGEEMAQLLSKSKYHGDYIFAFDNWRDRDLIVKALKIWKYYNPKRETKFYLFCGFMMKPGDDAHLYKDIWELFQRIKILMQYGCFGYVMRHEDYHNHELSNIYVQIARWCNQPQFYRYMSFWEYAYRNQSFWEQTTLRKKDVENIISYKEFIQKKASGYYEEEKMKICKPLQTLLDVLDRFPEHREELLEMFDYKLKNLANPSLWERKEEVNEKVECYAYY